MGLATLFKEPPTMTSPKRTPREQLLTTLPEQEREAMAPLSDSTIREVVAEGERDYVIVKFGFTSFCASGSSRRPASRHTFDSRTRRVA